MPKLHIFKPKELLRALLRMGFHIHHQRGSHVHLRHSMKPHLRVTIPFHARFDLPTEVTLSILRQAELSKKDLDILL